MPRKLKLVIVSLLVSLIVLANNNSSANSNIKSDSLEILQSDSDSLLTIAANVSYAKDILKKYINAIGGEDNLRSIYDRTTDMKGLIQGIETDIIFYQKSPNKLYQKIMVGEVEQKIIFDGTRGIKVIEDETQEITGDELIKLSFEAIMNLILEPDSFNIQIQYAGMDTVNDRNSYKIILTLPNNAEWLQYYDIESGLKLLDAKEIITPSGKYQQVTEFDNYRNVDGVLYPFKIKQYLGNQTLDFTVESIQINTGISDEMFQID